MENRIKRTFASLGGQGKSAFIPFVMYNDPMPVVCEQLFMGLPGAGADIIELGMPFTDPAADGASIQAAGIRALKHDFSCEHMFALVAWFRAQYPDTPVVLMGYYNIVYAYDVAQFAEDAAAAGVDGMIIVDLPPEEASEFTVHAEEHGIALIRLVAPTTSPDRAKRLVETAQGFVYYVSVTGVTGTKKIDSDATGDAVKRLKEMTDLPIGVGFGVRTPADAARVAQTADAVIVGSALCDTIKQSLDAGTDPVQNTLQLVKQLSDAVHNQEKTG